MPEKNVTGGTVIYYSCWYWYGLYSEKAFIARGTRTGWENVSQQCDKTGTNVFVVDTVLDSQWVSLLDDKSTRTTKKLLTPPPPYRTKTKDLFINLRFNCFEVFTLGIESFFRQFEARPEEEGKILERNLNVALTPWSASVQVKLPFPACFLSILWTVKNSRVDRWLG